MFVILQVARIFTRIELFLSGFCLESARCFTACTHTCVFNILCVLIIEKISLLFILLFLQMLVCKC